MKSSLLSDTPGLVSLSRNQNKITSNKNLRQVSPEFQPSSLQPCVQPECAQTGSVIPCCICVFSLHRAVAGKVPKTCPGHSLSPVPHPRPCPALWSSAQTAHRPRRLSAPVAASLEGRAGQVLANYRVNDQLGEPSAAVPGWCPQREPRCGQGLLGTGCALRGARDGVRSPGDEEGISSRSGPSLAG